MGSGEAVLPEEVKQDLSKAAEYVRDIESSSFGLEWLAVNHLLYAKDENEVSSAVSLRKCQRPHCSKIEEGPGQFQCCSGCQSPYCSRVCQKQDWSKGRFRHKDACSQLKSIRGGATVDAKEAVARCIGRVRLYACPFSVFHCDAVGRGLLFLQSRNTIAELAYLAPVDIHGKLLQRSLLLHYLTMGEFVDAVLQDDFELGTVKEPLEQAVASYDMESEIVVLLRTACGYLAVIKMPIVPDLGVCKALASDYAGKDALELRLDDA
ncbi:unnamed protein product [Chrysoparadoxa australica]